MTVLYTLHWEDTGEIIQAGNCPTKDCLPEKPEGARFTFGVVGNPDIHRMDGDKPVLKETSNGRN